MSRIDEMIDRIIYEELLYRQALNEGLWDETKQPLNDNVPSLPHARIPSSPVRRI